MTDRSVQKARILAGLAATFRENGYEGASLARLARAAGLQKASLYHHFPGGKEEMAAAVLDDLTTWFDRHLFAALANPGPVRERIAVMVAALDEHHAGGREASLFAQFGEGPTRDRFADRIAAFYGRWIASLGGAIVDTGLDGEEAVRRAADAVMVIEGAIVLSRALGDPGPFRRVLRHLPDALATPAEVA
jgi:AcrR family transcriptional regulator